MLAAMGAFREIQDVGELLIHLVDGAMCISADKRVSASSLGIVGNCLEHQFYQSGASTRHGHEWV